MMMKRTALALLLAIAAPLCAQDYAEEALPDPAQEARAVALMDTIRCVVCQGQPISGSNADLAGDMRRLVRERIAAGDTPEQVRTWLIGRYGAWISLKPPVDERTAPLWLIPLAALVGGGLLAARRFKKRKD